MMSRRDETGEGRRICGEITDRNFYLEQIGR